MMQAHCQKDTMSLAIAASAMMVSLATFHYTFGSALIRALVSGADDRRDAVDIPPAARVEAAEEDAAAAEPVGTGAVQPAASATPDDLTRIKGLGPKLQTELNTLGIYNFQQIADWTPEQVDWFDTNLGGIPGSVTRGGWVEQARQLAEGDSA